MKSRLQFEMLTREYLVSGNISLANEIVRSSSKSAAFLLEAFVEFVVGLSFLNSKPSFQQYVSIITVKNRILEVIRRKGKASSERLILYALRESPLYRNAIAFILSVEEKPSREIISSIYSLDDLPSTWEDEPAHALLLRSRALFGEEAAIRYFQKKCAELNIDMDTLYVGLDYEAIQFINEHSCQFSPGDLTADFLSPESITQWRSLSQINCWEVSPTNIIPDDEPRLFDAPIINGLGAPSIRITRVEHGNTVIKWGYLLGTGSHLIVYNLKSKTAYGFPFRSISNVYHSQGNFALKLESGGAVQIHTKFPNRSLLGSLAILGAPPSQKYFHYAIEQDRANTAESFTTIFSGFFDEIVEENRRRSRL